MDVKAYCLQMVRDAKEASRSLATATTDDKDAVLEVMAQSILDARPELKEQNGLDLEAGRAAGLSSAMLDRLELTDRRIDEMARSIRTVAELRDPVGRIIDGWALPNGLKVQKRRVPIGVVCIIYESRPNVTADAAALCLKSGNAVILRGGKEALKSNLAIRRCLARGFEGSSINPKVIQLIETTDRAAVCELLTADAYVDVVIPRGGKGLVKAVAETATVPVIKHYEGVCHTYVDSPCDLEMAVRICENAKCQRPGTCNAMETLLVHEAVAGDFLPSMSKRLESAGVDIRGCPRTLSLLPHAKPADEADWFAEFLDLILAIKVVSSMDEAFDHIDKYGSNHTEAIISRDYRRTQRFLAEVDSSVVLANASTRFNDGNQLGLGAEIGINTSKLHAYGPMGLEELTTTKFVVYGDGQIRT